MKKLHIPQWNEWGKGDLPEEMLLISFSFSLYKSDIF